MTVNMEMRDAVELDAGDSLGIYREKFSIPKDEHGREYVYMLGNSLGLSPRNASDFVLRELNDWELLGSQGHRSTDTPWISFADLLTPSLMKIVGGREDEVISMNSLTINLHLMLSTFYRPSKERYKILMEGKSFPSDRYAVVSHLKLRGYDESALIEVFPKPGSYGLIDDEDIKAMIDDHGSEIALVLIGGVQYYSGQVFDMQGITKRAHSNDCMVGFDLAHGVGNIDLNLHQWGPDFAVWCSYKYLNGGPGAVAGAFVHSRYSDRFDLNRPSGWWGNKFSNRFMMSPDFDPEPGIKGWQLSNPPLFSLAAMRASFELFEEVGLERLRKKSKSLTSYLLKLIDDLVPEGRITATPQDEKQRGCQLSLHIPGAKKELVGRLKKHGVIADWREPEVVRVAPVPFYNSYQDVYDLVATLQKVLG